jgi:hypothetical protein
MSVYDPNMVGIFQKDLGYWRSRAAQIEWRLARAKAEIKDMEKDFNESIQNVKFLEAKNNERLG